MNYEFFLPANEKDISIKIRTTYLRCKGNTSLFRKDYAVDVMLEMVVPISLCCESSSHLLKINALAFPHICRVQRRISGDYNRTWDYLWSLLVGFLDATVEFFLIEDVEIINNTYQSCRSLYQNSALLLELFELIIFEAFQKMMKEKVLWYIVTIF